MIFTEKDPEPTTHCTATPTCRKPQNGTGPEKTSQTVSVCKLKQFRNTPENFKGGKIIENVYQWRQLTSDKYILNIVESGYKLEFESEPCEHCL